MPRNYIRKKIKTYTPQDLAEAIKKVNDGELTQYSAAQLYKIPITTLHDNIKQNTSSSKAGRPIVIPLEDEKKLAEAIIVMEKWGFGLSRYEIMDIVADYVRANKIRTPFKNNIPGPDWFINFRKRHRLSIKKAQPVEYIRRKMTDPFIIDEYFKLLEMTLNDLNLFESPQVIWNLDETSMCLDPSRTKVVGKINKPCARTTHGSGKENITVLTGASASGKKLPPLIVFKGKYVWDQWMADLDPSDYDFELSYAASTKGWMETNIFYNYIEKIFIPNLGDKRPVLVIYDGHSTHVDVRVVQLAIQNQITILKLPPHTSHLLQPMDIAVFKSFKAIWDAKLVDWQRRNVGTKMPKKVFAQALADTWQQTSSDIIKTGFKKSGIYPFNALVIPVDKYEPDAYKRYQKKISEAHFSTHPNPKNPKTLKEICIDQFNNLPKTCGALESSGSNVTLLTQVPKSDMQMLSFAAEHPSEIPLCLRNSKPIESQILRSPPRINIISNIVIKEATQPPLKSLPQAQQVSTFEELVLRKIQQDKKATACSAKKKRVTKGAEVITATMGKKILEEVEKTKAMKAQTKPRKQKTKNNRRINKQDEDPGPSGFKYKNKRKRQPSVDSTSVSDIWTMSEHSDSDIADVESIDEYSEEFKEEQRSQKKTKGLIHNKKVKECKILLNKKLFTKKDLNTLCNKGKGIGKKSKGKENKMSLKDKEEIQEKYVENEKEYDINRGKKNQINREKETHMKINDENKIDLFMIDKNRTTGEDLKKQIDREKKKERYVESDNEDYVDLQLPSEEGSKLKEIDEQMQLQLENKDLVCETQEDPTMKEIYKLNDSVLVRYLVRKKWKYFIGFIEEITNHEEIYYSINFLKTLRKHQQLVFKMPKKKDVDHVPELLIAKKIELKNKEKEKVYYLRNDEDAIYFD